MRHYLIVLFAMLFLITAMTSGIGCGKKGPPMPAEVLSVQAPYGLDFTLINDELTLTWSHPSRESGVIECRKFQIYQSKIDKTGKECPDCPKVFSLLTSVEPDKFVHTMLLESGFHYYFRVKALGDGPRASSFSNTVKVEF